MAEVPGDIIYIINDLANWSVRNRGKLDYKEILKFKADVINDPGRWLADRVSIPAFKEACLAAGLASNDVDTLVDLVRKSQSGKRQRVDHHIYKPYRFPFPYK